MGLPGFVFASREFKSPGAEGPRRRVGARFSRLAIQSPSLARVRCKVGPLQELPELPGAVRAGCLPPGARRRPARPEAVGRRLCRLYDHAVESLVPAGGGA